jgi:hypothetical protein
MEMKVTYCKKEMQESRNQPFDKAQDRESEISKATSTGKSLNVELRPPSPKAMAGRQPVLRSFMRRRKAAHW